MLRSPIFHAIAGIAILPGILAFVFWPVMVSDEAPPKPVPAPQH